MPTINPVAGLEPMMGSSIKLLAPSDFTLGGLFKAPRIRSGRSRSGHRVSDLTFMESWAETNDGLSKISIKQKFKREMVYNPFRNFIASR